ncbi:MAG: POTRA domain-containing protein, partial [Acidobacteriota bacterium]
MRSVQGLALSWWVAVALCVSAWPARAQSADAVDRLAGRPITAVHLDIEGRRSDARELLDLLEVQPGQPLDLAQVRASIVQLHSAGRFEDIRVRGVASDAGVELVFDLVPRHPVDRVAFAGVRGVSSGELERDLRQRFNGLPRAAQADAAARNVERTLAERGYRQANVHPSITTAHLPDRATLLLTVDMGPLTVVTSAKVEGASPLSPADVLKRAGVAVGQPYRSRDIDLGLDAIIADLRTRGYYDAVV